MQWTVHDDLWFQFGDEEPFYLPGPSYTMHMSPSDEALYNGVTNLAYFLVAMMVVAVIALAVGV